MQERVRIEINGASVPVTSYLLILDATGQSEQAQISFNGTIIGDKNKAEGFTTLGRLTTETVTVTIPPKESHGY